MKYSINPCYKRSLLTCFYLLWSYLSEAQFTAGNLVVLQAGDGTTALVNTGNKILLREFDLQGLATFSVAVPTAAAGPLLISGSASSEGALSLSANGKYLVFAGYARSLPNTTALSGSSASAINRGVGIVDAAGGYTRIATSTTFFTGNNIRGAASDGNHNYWAAGSNNGTAYFGLNAPALAVQNAVTNTRCISVANNSLYLSCGSGTFGICRAGSSLPFASGQGASLVINTANTGSGASSPYGFCFHPSLTVCYVADDRSAVNGGGIQKWMNSAGSWSLAYTLGTGANYGARGLAVDFSGAVPRVYATTSEGSSNRLIAISDAGAGSTATTLATAAANSIFRGLAFSPNCADPKVISVSSGTPACSGQPLSLSAFVSVPGTPAFSWVGPGNFVSSQQNPLVSNPLSGSYSFSVSNACGKDTARVLVQVIPLPPLTVNQAVVCTGGTAVFTVSGAASYTWSTGSTASVFSINPAGSATYTVSGLSQQGCANTVTASVLVVNSLVLSAGSATVCAGNATVLAASGAGTYTWSTGANTAAITITPQAGAVYSVTGDASGCAAPVTATLLVTVNALPSVSLQLAQQVLCLNEPAIPLNGSPAGGQYSGAGSNGAVFVPDSAGSFTVAYAYTDGNSCSNTDAKLIQVSECTGLAEPAPAAVWQIYPNPAADVVFVSHAAAETCRVELYSSEGRLLQEVVSCEGQVQIGLSSYPRGIYFIKVSGVGYLSGIKLLKE